MVRDNLLHLIKTLCLIQHYIKVDSIIQTNPNIIIPCIGTDILKAPEDIFGIIESNNLGIIVKIIRKHTSYNSIFYSQDFLSLLTSSIYSGGVWVTGIIDLFKNNGINFKFTDNPQDYWSKIPFIDKQLLRLLSMGFNDYFIKNYYANVSYNSHQIWKKENTHLFIKKKY